MRRAMTATVMCIVMLLASSATVEAAPGLEVIDPQDGAMLDGTSITVTFQVSDFTLVPTNVPLSEAGKHPEVNNPGEGHVHLMLDLNPLIVWERSDPYVFTNVAPGEHVLMVEIVNNDHSPLSPAVVRQFRFRTNAPQILPLTGHADAGAATRVGTVLLAIAGVALVVLGGVLRRMRV